LLDEFKAYLRQERGIDFSDEAFLAELEYIRDSLQFTLISQYHGEGAARQAVLRADLALAKAVDLLTEADTLADLFRLADRERQASLDDSETLTTASREPAAITQP
jgi:hypothetical protein